MRTITIKWCKTWQVTLALLCSVFLCPAAIVQPQPSEIDYTQLLQAPESTTTADTSPAFRKVMGPRDFQFPADHGSHPDYRLEWWYITGHLQSQVKDKHHQWGFQITFFRIALAPPKSAATPQPTTPQLTPPQELWQSPQMFMGHFAISDAQRKRHIQFERLSRQGAKLAGVSNAPTRVWLDNWQLIAQQDDRLFPANLTALATDQELGPVSLTLEFQTQKPRVLQGDRGYSRKSATPGNASYYYSYTRLEAVGQLKIGDQVHPVRGNAWLDREWSSSSLDSDQQGWDWFALQLEDGRDLMFYRLRYTSGQADPFSHGLLVEADGSYRRIAPEQIHLQPQSYWRSPSGINYPLKWRLAIPSAGLTLDIRPLFDDQEWRQRLRYWEGAVLVSGSHRGRGYLELAGYRP